MKLQYFGHSCFKINLGKHAIIFDPFISANEKANAFKPEEIEASHILVSHGHMDHTLDVETIAKKNESVIISNYEIFTHYKNKGFNGHPLNQGGSWNFDFGKVKYVNAVHSSSFADGTYAGNPGGFVVSNDDVCFYFAGDTALTMDMKLIPMTSPELDFCILPIGDCFTMGIDEAIIAAQFVQCNKVIGCHYDTFGFIKINHEEAKEKFAKAGIELILMDIGESIEL